MKGVFYNLQFQKPNDEYITYNNITMKDLIDKIKHDFKNNYFLDVKINNQIIYNLIKRPLSTKKLFREKLKVDKI